MEKRTFESALGPIWLWGRDTGRPILLALAGLYSNPTFGLEMQEHWPDIDLIVGRVPGDGAPELFSPSIGVFAAGYAEALAALFPDRPVVGYGVSTGALILMALRGLNMRRLLLIEPPIKSGDLWPLRDALRGDGPEGWERITWPVFGIDHQRHEPRDYAPLVAGLATPTTVLVGSEPLMPRRPLDDLPTLVDDESRALLRQHAMVEMIEVQGVGHNMLTTASAQVLPHLRRLISASRAEGNGAA